MIGHSHETTGWYEWLFWTLGEISGKPVAGKDKESINKVNRFLGKFREILEATEIVEKGLSIKIQEIDSGEFAVRRINKRTVLFSQQLRFIVIDDSQNWATRKNVTLQPQIHKKFQELVLTDTESDMRIRIVDSAFSDDEKGPAWPVPRGIPEPLKDKTARLEEGELMAIYVEK